MASTRERGGFVPRNEAAYSVGLFTSQDYIPSREGGGYVRVSVITTVYTVNGIYSISTASGPVLAKSKDRWLVGGWGSTLFSSTEDPAAG